MRGLARVLVDEFFGGLPRPLDGVVVLTLTGAAAPVSFCLVSLRFTTATPFLGGLTAVLSGDSVTVFDERNAARCDADLGAGSFFDFLPATFATSDSALRLGGLPIWKCEDCLGPKNGSWRIGSTEMREEGLQTEKQRRKCSCELFKVKENGEVRDRNEQGTH